MATSDSSEETVLDFDARLLACGVVLHVFHTTGEKVDAAIKDYAKHVFGEDQWRRECLPHTTRKKQATSQKAEQVRGTRSRRTPAKTREELWDACDLLSVLIKVGGCQLLPQGKGRQSPRRCPYSASKRQQSIHASNAGQPWDQAAIA